MGKQSILGPVLAGMIAAVLAGYATSPRAEDNRDLSGISKGLSQAKISIEQALKLSRREGIPISAKYEIEYGAFQLSVYTMKGSAFFEVIVDHETGAIKKSEPLVENQDKEDAKNQSRAVAAATVTLEAAVEKAVKANPGYRALSVVPTILKGGKPVAEVALIHGTSVRKVTEKLN